MRLYAICRAAFRPRQLILVLLAAGIWACKALGIHDVTRLEEGCLLLGFLSYKVSFLCNGMLMLSWHSNHSTPILAYSIAFAQPVLHKGDVAL